MRDGRDEHSTGVEKGAHSRLRPRLHTQPHVLRRTYTHECEPYLHASRLLVVRRPELAPAIIAVPDEAALIMPQPAQPAPAAVALCAGTQIEET
eukprot:7380602-Prymnesium_polylepis.1